MRVGGFFTRRPRRWSLKTQQCDHAETSRAKTAAPATPVRPSSGITSDALGHEALKKTRHPCFGMGDTFELKLNVIGLHPFADATDLHGEFDPGSGRTLAARLTHASRART